MCILFDKKKKYYNEIKTTNCSRYLSWIQLDNNVVSHSGEGDMVDLTVLPSNGLPGNHVIWRKKEGTKFAKRIRQKRQELIARFIVRNTIGVQPVEASVCMLDCVRPYRAYPMILKEKRNVGFLVGQFFVLLDFDVLKKSVQEAVGEKNYEIEEMMDAIFSRNQSKTKNKSQTSILDYFIRGSPMLQ